MFAELGTNYSEQPADVTRLQPRRQQLHPKRTRSSWNTSRARARLPILKQLREEKGSSHLKHQSNQNENHQAEDDVGVVLNEELLAEERVALVPPAERHVSPVPFILLFYKSQFSWLRSSGVNFIAAVRMRVVLKGECRKFLLGGHLHNNKLCSTREIAEQGAV